MVAISPMGAISRMITVYVLLLYHKNVLVCITRKGNTARKRHGSSVGIEIDFVVVWVVEIDWISVWVIEVDMIPL